MITLKLLKNTVVQGGQFFDQVTEAANRGCKLTWNMERTFATQVLDTKEFITDSNVVDIINSGGEVNGYIFKMNFAKDKFENDSIPKVLADYLNISLDEENTTYPLFKDVFTFAEPVYDVDENEQQLETFSNYLVINSVNGKLLPMSLTLEIV